MGSSRSHRRSLWSDWLLDNASHLPCTYYARARKGANLCHDPATPGELHRLGLGLRHTGAQGEVRQLAAALHRRRVPPRALHPIAVPGTVYARLLGFIAHYNIHGFYDAQMSTPERRASFLRSLERSCNRSPTADARATAVLMPGRGPIRPARFPGRTGRGTRDLIT